MKALRPIHTDLRKVRRSMYNHVPVMVMSKGSGDDVEEQFWFVIMGDPATVFDDLGSGLQAIVELLEDIRRSEPYRRLYCTPKRRT